MPPDSPHGTAASVRAEIRETLKLAVPIAFAQVALMAMGLVDAALVGRVSDVELSAVSIGNSIVFAAVCPAMGVTMAVEPLTSQAIGALDPARAWTSLRAGLFSCLLLAVPTLAATWAATYLLAPLGVAADVIPLARGYVLARLPGVPAFLLFLGAKAYLEARGLTRPLLVAGWVANVVNLICAWVLIFGDAGLTRLGLPAIGAPALGSVGAGLSSALGTWFLALWALLAVYLARPTGAAIFARSLDLFATTRKLVRVGVPIGFQLLTEIGVFSLVSVLAGRLGARVSAAHQIALGIASFTFMGVLGIGAATAVRVGRSIGAEEAHGPRRAGLVGVGIAAGYMSLCALLFLLFARPIARLFTSDEAVVDVAAPLLRIAAAFQIFDGIQGVASGALRGAADTTFASWANVVCHWCLGLPVALVLGFSWGWGARGLWWGLSFGLGCAAVVLLVRFVRLTSRAIAAV